jgi:hypothetical protein
MVFGRSHRNDPIRGEGVQWKRQQTRLFLGEGLGDSTAVVSRPGARRCDLITPHPRLTVAFGERGEGAARPEGIPHLTNGTFHAACLITGPDLARTCREEIVSA